jgi:hypothetical protein
MAFVLAGCGDDTDSGSAPETTTTLASTTSSTASTTTAPPGPLKCQSVGFTPNSEDGAFDVMATGLSCAEAEAFVRNAGARTSSGGPPSVTVDGYRCVLTRSEQEPLPQAFYECTNGSKKVTFVRS